MEYNKIKLLYNSDVLDNYDKSLRKANIKLEDSKREFQKMEEVHQEELKSVFYNN